MIEVSAAPLRDRRERSPSIGPQRRERGRSARRRAPAWTRRVADEPAGQPEDQEAVGIDREQRREGQAVGQQAAGGATVGVEDGPDERDPRLGRGRARGSPPGPSRRGVSSRGPRTGRLDVLGADAPRRRDQRPDLAAPDEAAAAELDALEPPGPRPAADRRRREVDVGRGQDLGRLGQGDPVGRRRPSSVGRRRPSVAGLASPSSAFAGASVAAAARPSPPSRRRRRRRSTPPPSDPAAFAGCLGGARRARAPSSPSPTP